MRLSALPVSEPKPLTQRGASYEYILPHEPDADAPGTGAAGSIPAAATKNSFQFFQIIHNF
jgi:hypothetical protein